jgi:hypothetical protein
MVMACIWLRIVSFAFVWNFTLQSFGEIFFNANLTKPKNNNWWFFGNSFSKNRKLWKKIQEIFIGL